MGGAQGSPAQLTFEALPALRSKTEIISRLLHEQLSGHLETLRPILSPDRLFGKSGGPRTDAAAADRALAQLHQSYKAFVGRPFDLPTELDPYWLTLVGNRVALYPWTYTYEAGREPSQRSITMTSPVRWVVSFTSGYTLAELRQALLGPGERRAEHVRQFVVNALVTQLVFAHTPGLAALFADLRYQVQVDTAPELPKLPLATVTSSLPSFRPSDELVLAATNFSGIPAFIELIDVDALPALVDPLQAKIAERLR